MRFSLLFALPAAVSAISLVDWVGHNGLVSDYQAIMREHKGIYDMVNKQAKDSLTVFVPTNTAIKAWKAEASTAGMTWTAVNDLFEYMIVHHAYTIKDLEAKTMTSLTTYLDGHDVKATTYGVKPDQYVIISSGTGYMRNSTAGVRTPDFKIDQGYVQLVDKMFKLPTGIEITANKDMASAASSSVAVSSFLALSAVGGVVAMLL